MSRYATPASYLLFAVATLLTVAAITTPIVLLRLNAIEAQAERDTAIATTGALAPVLGPEIAGPELTSFAEVAGGLIGDSVRSIRLWSNDGELLATTGSDTEVRADRAALFQASAGEVASSKISAPEGDLLASYTELLPGAFLEIEQDYGPVAASVAAARQDLLVVVGSGMLAIALLVPLVHWLAVRGLRGEYHRLRELHRAGQAVRSTLDLPEVLERLAADTARCTRSRLGFVALVEEANNALVLQASYDAQQNVTAQHHLQVEEWFLRRCAATGETVLSEEEGLPRLLVFGAEEEQERPATVLCVVIPGRERAIGVVMVARDTGKGPFTAPEMRMAEEMAVQAALAIDQSLLFAKMRRYADEIEVSYDNTLRVLTAALDTKDADTHGHSERVSRLTVEVAKEVGISDDRLVNIERGALLHDIGKIGVPDRVLHKPAALDEKEWEAMQKHPLLAGLMISKVEFLEGAMPILLYHHERYDGEGYPFGLEGGAIPIEARIFAVVDSYDAMTSDRPYRKAMGSEAALREIERNSATQFDPQVVEAFKRLIERLQPTLKQAS